MSKPDIDLDTFVKVEMIRDVPLEEIVKLMNEYEASNKELKQKADQLESLVLEYRKYLIIEHKKKSVPRHDPEKSHFFMQLDEKLKQIKDE